MELFGESIDNTSRVDLTHLLIGSGEVLGEFTNLLQEPEINMDYLWPQVHLHKFCRFVPLKMAVFLVIMFLSISYKLIGSQATE